MTDREIVRRPYKRATGELFAFPINIKTENNYQIFWNFDLFSNEVKPSTLFDSLIQEYGEKCPEKIRMFIFIL
jgi:hypothetical protein